MYNINIQEKTELNKLIYKHASIFYRFCANFLGKRNIEVKDTIDNILKNIAGGSSDNIIQRLKNNSMLSYDDTAKRLEFYAIDESTKDNVIESLERSFEGKTPEEIKEFFQGILKCENDSEQTSLFYIIGLLKSKCYIYNEKKELEGFDEEKFKKGFDKIIDILIEKKLSKIEIFDLFLKNNPKVEDLLEQEQPYHSKNTVSLLNGYAVNKLFNMSNEIINSENKLINEQKHSIERLNNELRQLNEEKESLQKNISDSKKILSTSSNFGKFIIGVGVFSCGMVGMSLVVLTAAYSITYFKLLNLDVQNMANIAVEIAFKVFVASLVAMAFILTVSNIEKNNRISKSYDILPSVEDKENTQHNESNGYESEEKRIVVDNEDYDLTSHLSSFPSLSSLPSLIFSRKVERVSPIIRK